MYKIIPVLTNLNMNKFIELGNPILRNTCRLINKKELQTIYFQDLLKKLSILVQDEGVGLAAPQIGENVQVFIFNLPDPQSKTNKIKFIINPKIISYSKILEFDQEACLSVPGFIGFLERPIEVEVEFINEKGIKKHQKLKNFKARVFQHEFDHLHGTLYVDKIVGKKVESFIDLKQNLALFNNVLMTKEEFEKKYCKSESPR
ncbi:MAG: peptide deformylase [Candidatus Margulisiibacteriota bacterium]|jgi:peptide deformylase